MELTWLHYTAAVLAGALAGVVNTLAGSGSLITLPMLMLLGLSAELANATNRIGVVLGALVGAQTFRKGGHLSIRTGNLAWLAVPAIAGSIIGALVATRLDAQAMQQVIGVVMVIMLVVILIKPKRWLIDPPSVEPNHRDLLTVLLFFLIGVYGGFIQAGVGIFLLAALVLRARYSLVQANALKVLLVLVFTVPALAVFIAKGQVYWRMGLLIAVGQCLGSWAAATFATKHPQANVWIRRLLILIVCLAILKMFGVVDILFA
jgi:uncharacterized membrane protein YfcA